MGMHRSIALLAASALVLQAACLRKDQQTVVGLKTPAETSGSENVPPALNVIPDLAGPESVLYDREQDVYFISNINGGLLAPDDNGFISRVDAKTLQVTPRWIAGGTAGVRLDAPKGMAVVGDTLYVSDIAGVRTFDRRSGAPRGLLPIPGATLVNDLTTDGTSVYVSDTGVRPAAGITFAATGTDAIWKISNGRAEKIASGTDLDQPNGIDWHDGSLWVATFRGDSLYRLDGAKKKDVTRVPKGQLDGLVHLADGTTFVTSWIGKAVYRASKRGEFTPLLRGLAAPADIGYDTTRRRLLVPNSPMNQVTIHAVQ